MKIMKSLPHAFRGSRPDPRRVWAGLALTLAVLLLLGVPSPAASARTESVPAGPFVAASELNQAGPGEAGNRIQPLKAAATPEPGLTFSDTLTLRKPAQVRPMSTLVPCIPILVPCLPWKSAPSQVAQ